MVKKTENDKKIKQKDKKGGEKEENGHKSVIPMTDSGGLSMGPRSPGENRVDPFAWRSYGKYSTKPSWNIRQLLFFFLSWP